MSSPLSLLPAAVLTPVTPSVAVKPFIAAAVQLPGLLPANAALSVAHPPRAASIPESTLPSALFDGALLRPAASVDLPVPPSREDFALTIDSLLSTRRAELLALSNRYSSASPDEKKPLDARIQSIVDELNVLKLPAGRSVHDLSPAPPDFSVNQFVSSPEYPKYRAAAESRLLRGEYIPQFIYAGAATRLLQDFEEVLGRKLDPLPYRMYGLDLWDVLRRMRSLDESSLLKLFTSQKVPNPALMISRLKSIEIPAEAPALGMGPRQILAYTSLLERLALRHAMSPRAVLRRQRPVFHVNEEIAASVIEDFKKNAFYGFDRSKVVFIIQPIFKGYRLEERGAEQAVDSPALPFGHGYAAAQLKHSDAFTIDAAGRPAPLGMPFLDAMIAADAKGRFVVATHRINDATKFTTEQVVDLDGLALSLSLLDKGYGVTIDLVGNPGKQKGGNNLRFAGDRRSFLIETSNSKGSPELTALLDDAAKTGAPYNAFRLTSTPATYKKLLDAGIPYNLRFKNGFFYLESVTGDLTQLPDSHSVAIQKEGELIHDFKQLANLLDALEYLRKQDSGRRAP